MPRLDDPDDASRPGLRAEAPSSSTASRPIQQSQPRSFWHHEDSQSLPGADSSTSNFSAGPKASQPADDTSPAALSATKRLEQELAGQFVPSHKREIVRGGRHSDVPATLFGGGSSSIFGSGPSQEAPPARPPLLSLTHPSQDDEEEAVPRASGPLAGLSGASNEGRRNDQYADEVRATVDRRRRMPRVEKDADDPTDPTSPQSTAINRRGSTPMTTLSRLFAVQAAVSPEQSRSTSYTSHPKRQMSNYTRQLISAEGAGLTDHLYARGLIDGRHSDITVFAFGHGYKLHRIILDRAPFFTIALSEPWLEANAKEMTVHPEDIDSTITQHSFELALKRLYGCNSLGEEDADAIGLFATGCWLEMQDLIDASIESMLRQMTPATLSPLIKLVTSNYYGRAGDKILASAKAMLCRDGWKMRLKHWDGIPGDIIREIVGGDGFFVDGEWDRWVLAKRILDRRLKGRAIEGGLVMPGNRRKVLKAPDTVNLMAVRFDTVYRRNSVGTGRGVPDGLQRWIAPYTHTDVEPILVLLDEGIHYLHLDFEQLQFIRRSRDVLGLPVMPEKVMSDALWQQMELRQRIMNTRENEMELGISFQAAEEVEGEVPASKDTTMSITTPSSPPLSKGKQKATSFEDDPAEAEYEDLDSGSWDGNGKPRKFWIPSSDCNIVMGGNADPVIATSSNPASQRHANRLSATLQPEDAQWGTDFAAAAASSTAPRPSTAESQAEPAPPPVNYTHFPPFRFSAEFQNPRLMKERKRIYSRTVFYAGSLWNIYVQKVASPRTKQLGVYLHRAKERETEEVVAGTAGLAQGSVDERIGQLEREMILRSEDRERRRRRRTTLGSDGHDPDGAESSGSAGDPEGTLVGNDGLTQQSRTMRNLLARNGGGDPTTSRQQQSSNTQGPGPQAATSALSNALLSPSPSATDSDSDADSDSDEALSSGFGPRTTTPASKFHVPTLPPYVDGRPTIKTYFKIYSPSRGGRMLSVYESAPDKFNFSQSWGWKSSTLMLDEGLFSSQQGGEQGEMEKDEGGFMGGGGGAGEERRGGVAGGGGGVGAGAGAFRERGAGDGNGKLRFMVVIGNI
ncbi:hypothetical protein MBLNU230_g2905t1 [Neophaeotheca triangularis]